MRHHWFSILDNVVVPPECQKPSVLKLHDPGVDAGNPAPLTAITEVRSDIDESAVRTMPAVPAVIGYVKN